jgi:hypothetical protein
VAAELARGRPWVDGSAASTRAGEQATASAASAAENDVIRHCFRCMFVLSDSALG